MFSCLPVTPTSSAVDRLDDEVDRRNRKPASIHPQRCIPLTQLWDLSASRGTLLSPITFVAQGNLRDSLEDELCPRPKPRPGYTAIDIALTKAASTARESFVTNPGVSLAASSSATFIGLCLMRANCAPAITSACTLWGSAGPTTPVPVRVSRAQQRPVSRQLDNGRYVRTTRELPAVRSPLPPANALDSVLAET